MHQIWGETSLWESDEIMDLEGIQNFKMDLKNVGSECSSLSPAIVAQCSSNIHTTHEAPKCDISQRNYCLQS